MCGAPMRTTHAVEAQRSTRISKHHHMGKWRTLCVDFEEEKIPAYTGSLDFKVTAHTCASGFPVWLCLWFMGCIECVVYWTYIYTHAFRRCLEEHWTWNLTWFSCKKNLSNQTINCGISIQNTITSRFPVPCSLFSDKLPIYSATMCP